MLHIRYDMFLIALRLLKRAMIALDRINLGTDLTVKIAISYWYNLESESSSVGRASAFQAEGRRFETGLSLQNLKLPFLIFSSGVEQSGSSSGS